MRRRRRGKNSQWLDKSVDDFDSMKIRLGKSAKFDGAGVYNVVIVILSISILSSLQQQRYLVQLDNKLLF